MLKLDLTQENLIFQIDKLPITKIIFKLHLNISKSYLISYIKKQLKLYL